MAKTGEKLTHQKQINEAILKERIKKRQEEEASFKNKAKADFERKELKKK